MTAIFGADKEHQDSLRVAASSPGFANERKVDHLTIILEVSSMTISAQTFQELIYLAFKLYTRAYELFKKYGHPSAQNQGRLTLWIAYRIAQTYFQSGKFDMAVRWVVSGYLLFNVLIGCDLGSSNALPRRIDAKDGTSCSIHC